MSQHVKGEKAISKKGETLNFTDLLTVQGGGCKRGALKKEGDWQGRDDPLYVNNILGHPECEGASSEDGGPRETAGCLREGTQQSSWQRRPLGGGMKV